MKKYEVREDFVQFVSPNELQKEVLIYSDGMGFEYNPYFFIDRKSFDNYLVMYTISGVLYCCQDETDIVLYPGESILMDLNRPHKYYFDKGIPSRIAWATINGKPASDIIRCIQKNAGIPVKSNQREIYEHLLSLFEVSDQSIRDVFKQSERCYSILLDFLKEIGGVNKDVIENAQYNEFRREIWHKIIQNLHRDITLDELAESVSLSKYHFARTFRMAFGVSPMRFITEERIRQARYRLLNTREPIYQIAESLGFATPSYFTKVFKRETGISPSEYRESEQKKQGL